MDDPEVSETEMRASEIVYKRDSGLEVAYSEIPEADRARILTEIRTRAMRIEWFATHNMLDLKVSEGRRYPRRHMIVAFAVLLIGSVVVCMVLGIMQLLGLR